MRSRATGLLIVLVTGSLGAAGCTDDGTDAVGPAEVEWQVGDTWSYMRTVAGGTPHLYTREVVGIGSRDGQVAYELREGSRALPVEQTSYYRVGDLAFMGFDKTRLGAPFASLVPDDPVPFHYAFPLTVGEHGPFQTTLAYTTHAPDDARRARVQYDDVEITVTVGQERAHTLGERVFTVWPYAVHIDFRSDPFPDGVAKITGLWAPSVRQSVETTIVESGGTISYRLVDHVPADPWRGPPAYDLVEGLQSTRITEGLKARLAGAGYGRWLVHVEQPTNVYVESTPPGHDGTIGVEVDSVHLAPLGAEGAWVYTGERRAATNDALYQISARGSGERAFAFSTGDEIHSEKIRLVPGVVYELIVASNRPGMQTLIRFGDTVSAVPPLESGAIDVLRFSHERVRRELGPGPREHTERLEHVVVAAADQRIQGLVFARDASQEMEPDALATDARHALTFASAGVAVSDPDAVEVMFLGPATELAGAVDVSYQYSASFGLTSPVAYDLGAVFIAFQPAAG